MYVTGGRGGDVYHVTNLKDYSRRAKQKPMAGSLRYGIETAKGPRTIVFDVAGPLKLAAPLEIKRKENLTIAGQTSPGGITLWGYPLNIGASEDIVIRFIRVRCGDFNSRPVKDRPATDVRSAGHGRKDLDASSANAIDVGNGSERIILDHVSASWGMDETCSVTNARNVTIQHSIIAESLNDSFHAKGKHGYGSLVRGSVSTEDQAQGTGGFTLFGNLWAHHQQRSPAVGGQQKLAEGQSETERLRADVNVVNNVVYDWGQRPSHRSEDGEIRINFIGNCTVNGPSKDGAYVFHEGNRSRTSLYQRGNFIDANQDAVEDAQPIDSPAKVARTFRNFDEKDQFLGPEDGEPLNFFASVASFELSGDKAYARVVRSAGASLWRDAVDRRVMESLVNRAGGPIDSQEEFRGDDGKLAGIDDLPRGERPAGFDSDGDGLPDDFERSHGLDPADASDGNATGLSSHGYTNLEVYLDSLTKIPGA
jgi:hypothetical protein